MWPGTANSGGRRSPQASVGTPDNTWEPAQTGKKKPQLITVGAPVLVEREELEHLVHQIAERVGRALERMGLLRRDAESAWLELPPVEDADAMRQLIGSSATYRIAVGPQAHGFSLHAGVSCEAHQRDLRERLCRYVARPAVAEKRLTASAQGKVVYLLKTPYRDGTTHVVFGRWTLSPGWQRWCRARARTSPAITMCWRRTTAGVQR